MNRTTLLRQLFIIVVLPVLLVLFLLTFVSFNRTKNLFDRLNASVENIISDEIIHAISLQEKALEGIDKGMNDRLEQLTGKILDLYATGELDLETGDLIEVKRELGMDHDNEDIYVISTEGIVINTTYVKDLNLNFFNFGEKHKQYLLNIFDHRDFHCEGFGLESSTRRLKKYSYWATPDGKYIVELGAYSKKADEIINFNNILLNRIALTNEGIASIDLYFYADHPFTFNRSTVISDYEEQVLTDVFTSKRDTLIVSEYGEDNYSHQYIFVPRKDGVLYEGAVIRIKEDLDYEAMFFNTELIYSSLTVGVIGLLIAMSLTWLIRKKVANPLQNVNRLLQSLSRGEFKNANYLEANSRNEIGEISISTNTMVDGLKSITLFANSIKEGKFDIDFEELGPKDELGSSLIDMRDSIRRNRILEESHRVDEEKRAWVSSGLTSLSDIITRNNNNIDQLSDEFLKELIKYLNTNQGAIFYYFDDEDPAYLKLASAFAYGRKKFVEKTIEYGEGLVGACAYEKETTYITDVPEDYLEIRSGMGGASPRAILLVPIMTELHFVGVIEVASFYEIEKHQIELVEKLSENLAIAINNATLHSKTNEIVEENEMYKSRIQDLEAEIMSLQQEIISVKEELKNQVTPVETSLED